jgi:hypothetical protein
MMDFPLAQKLEAAGWPQGGSGKWIVDPTSLVGRHRVYEPTLEELFEACGRLLTALRQVDAGRWTATASTYEAGGTTPSEAIAKLWLRLEGERNVRPSSSPCARP